MSLCTTKGATSKQQSNQKRGEQAGGSRLKKVDGSSTSTGTKSGNASLCTTKSATAKQRSTQKREQPGDQGSRKWMVLMELNLEELHVHRLKTAVMLTVALLNQGKNL
jgi:hypothetical protein